MLSFKHITQKEYSTQKWKNGNGSTREIAVDSRLPFRWRISVADVPQSGPFSAFPGYDRKLTLLSGALQLKHASKATPTPLVPFRVHGFSGDDETHSTVTLPGQDFNLFCLRESAKGNCYPTSYKLNEEMHLPLRGNEHFLYVVSGKIVIHERNTEKTALLGPGDTASFSRPSHEEYFDIKTIGQEPSKALWVVIHLLKD